MPMRIATILNGRPIFINHSDYRELDGPCTYYNAKIDETEISYADFSTLYNNGKYGTSYYVAINIFATSLKSSNIGIGAFTPYLHYDTDVLLIMVINRRMVTVKIYGLSQPKMRVRMEYIWFLLLPQSQMSQ
jgi:hypothetical protein